MASASRPTLNPPLCLQPRLCLLLLLPLLSLPLAATRPPPLAAVTDAEWSSLPSHLRSSMALESINTALATVCRGCVTSESSDSGVSVLSADSLLRAADSGVSLVWQAAAAYSRTFAARSQPRERSIHCAALTAAQPLCFTTAATCTIEWRYNHIVLNSFSARPTCSMLRQPVLDRGAQTRKITQHSSIGLIRSECCSSCSLRTRRARSMRKCPQAEKNVNEYES